MSASGGGVGVCSGERGWVSALGGGGSTWSRGVSAPREGGCTCWGVSALGGVPGPRGGVCTGGCTWSRGVSAPGGCLLPGGVCSGGCLLLWGGCTWSGTPPCGQTDACKLITLPQTSFAGGNNSKNSRFMYHVIAKCKAICFVLEELILHIFFFKYFTSSFFFTIDLSV